MFSTPVSKSSELKNPPAIPKKTRKVNNEEDIKLIVNLMSNMRITSVSRKLVF